MTKHYCDRCGDEIEGQYWHLPPWAMLCHRCYETAAGYTVRQRRVVVE